MKCCKYCTATLERGENEKESNWKTRKYCNKAHAALHNAEKKRGK